MRLAPVAMSFRTENLDWNQLTKPASAASSVNTIVTLCCPHVAAAAGGIVAVEAAAASRGVLEKTAPAFRRRQEAALEGKAGKTDPATQ